MALDYNNKVEIPSHTVRVPNGDKVYIQYTVEAYRNKKGQPTSKRVSIGKLDPESGLMIPNNRYYELFNQQPKIVSQPSIVRSVGSYGVFRGVSTSLGLDKIVKKVFKERAEAIMSIAHYMFCEVDLYGRSPLVCSSVKSCNKNAERNYATAKPFGK